MTTDAVREYGVAQDWYFWAGLTFVQAVLWGWLYRKDAPIRRPLHANLERDQTKLDNLLKNGYELNTWSFWMVVTIHHFLGGFIALIGTLIPDQTLSVLVVRIGLSFEIGEDFLHYFQMVQCWCSPGSNEMFGEMFPGKLVWFGVACHHAVGSLAGSFVFIFIPYVFEAQFCIVLLLLSAVPNLIQYPFIPFVNLRAREVECLGRFVACLMLGGTGLSMYGRIFVFPPTALELSRWVAVEYGQGTANMLLVACGAFMLFVFAGLIMGLSDLKDAFKATLGYGPPEQKPVALLLGSAEASFMLMSFKDSSRRSLVHNAEADLVATRASMTSFKDVAAAS